MDKNLPTNESNCNKMKQNLKDIEKEFKIKQRDFERKLEFNNNSDPLSLWYQHILWISDNSEFIDKDQKLLINLIEKCIEKFASNSKYKNDIRFYAIFYKYTQLTSDADDVYDSIYSLSLFNKLSKFYISWSWVLINLSKDEKALEILNLGIENKAEPIALLIQAKEELEIKLKEKKLYSSEQSNSVQKLSEQHSSILTQTLRERKSRLSIDPLSTAVVSFSNRLSLSKSLKSTTPKENLLIKSVGNRKGFEILEEEESSESRLSSDKQINENQLSGKKFKILEEEEDENNKQVNLITGTKNNPINSDRSSDSNQATNSNQPKEQNNITKHQVKAKQNLIQKLKPLDNFKEPKIVIHEVLKAHQKFYSDLKKIYADSNTEYSFEEIRMRKIKKMMLKKRKESYSNLELIKEIEMLKAKIKENEKRDKEKESLQNQVDMLKKQIEMIIANSVSTQNTTKRCLDEVDCIGSGGKDEVDKSKKLKLSENKQFGRSKLREQQLVNTKTNTPAAKKDANEKELTIVRDMWNGTFANSQYSPSNFNQNSNKDQKPPNTQKKEFSIFKDPTQSNLTKINDFSYYPHLLSTTANQDNYFTIALPHDLSEFNNVKLASTPAFDRVTKKRP